jgi:hypothetical protein
MEQLMTRPEREVGLPRGARRVCSPPAAPFRGRNSWVATARERRAHADCPDMPLSPRLVAPPCRPKICRRSPSTPAPPHII